jgi:hypothetical protein
MLSTEFNSVTKLIKENEIPVVVFTDTSESYLINNINELINNARNNTEVSLDIVLEDLISLGGSGGDSRPYKVYTALLTQSGTDAPVATVLENTLGNIVWSYEDLGTYKGTLTGAFIENKTYYYLNTASETGNMLDGLSGILLLNSNEISVISISSGIDLINGVLINTPIEIRVYN